MRSLEPSRFVWWGQPLVLLGRTDGVKAGLKASGQRSPIKAVAKCARHRHLTVTPAPTPREPLFTTDGG